MNIVLDGFVCPNCFNTVDYSKGEIMSDAFSFDFRRHELYCNKCGLVVKDQSITTLEILDYLVVRDTKFKTTDMSKTIYKNQFIDAYDIINYLRAMKKKDEEEREKERIRKREEQKAKARATREKNKKKKAKAKKNKK